MVAMFFIWCYRIMVTYTIILLPPYLTKSYEIMNEAKRLRKVSERECGVGLGGHMEHTVEMLLAMGAARGPVSTAAPPLSRTPSTPTPQPQPQLHRQVSTPSTGGSGGGGGGGGY